MRHVAHFSRIYIPQASQEFSIRFLGVTSPQIKKAIVVPFYSTISEKMPLSGSNGPLVFSSFPCKC